MKNSQSRLYAMSMFNALGADLETIWRRLIQGDCSSVRLTSRYSQQNQHRLGVIDENLIEVPQHLKHLDSPNSQVLLSTYQAISSQVEALKSRFGSDRIAVIIGTSTSGISTGENAIANLTKSGRLPDGYIYSQQEIGSVAEVLARYAGIDGAVYTVSTACSSSAKVFRSAQVLLEKELADAVIVGGCDTLCKLTVNGFAALELLSAEHTNPMSKNRKGINLGEGACLFILTRESGGIQLLGVGESSDAYHMSTPDPAATGAIAALRAALTQAEVSAEQVSYLNLHGTGTLHNDAMEARAVQAVVPEIPCSSTKPMVGHMLGASGATEVGFCWLLLQHFLHSKRGALIPLLPHCYDGISDPSLPALNLVPNGMQRSFDAEMICLSNSFGFGGSNCSVVLGASHQ